MRQETFASRMKSSNYLQSFHNLNPKIFILMLYDALFLVITMLLSQGLSSFLKMVDVAKLAELQYNLSQSVTSGAAGEGVMYSQDVGTIFTTLFIYLALFLIGVMINWSVFRGLAYQLVYDKRFLFKNLAKFIGINLLLVVAFSLLAFVITSAFNTTVLPYLLLIFILLFAHLTTLIYHTFFYLGDLKSALKMTFTKGFTKIHKFILPYVLAIITLLITMLPFALLSKIVPDYLGTLLYIIPGLFTLSWSRIYLSRIVMHVIPRIKK